MTSVAPLPDLLIYLPALFFSFAVIFFGSFVLFDSVSLKSLLKASINLFLLYDVWTSVSNKIFVVHCLLEYLEVFLFFSANAFLL